MEKINEIRGMAAEGYRLVEISQKVNVDVKTVRKYINAEDFSPEPPRHAGRPSKLDPYKDVIDKWLADDEKSWYKQRHTAERISKRLKAEYGCDASYSIIQRYVKAHRENKQTKANLELIWEAGCAQVDFGEADFIESGDTIRKKYLALSFPQSNQGFEQIFGGENAECVCQGLKNIFYRIGGVPKLLVFDNATGVGKRFGEVARESKLFALFRAHHRFRVRFCNPNAGWEKGNIENKIGTIRRNLFVPIPEYDDIDEYNLKLLDIRDGRSGEEHYKKGILIGDLFMEDQSSLLPLPAKEFDVCRYEMMQADGYGKVCIDAKHWYSTRPELARSRVLLGIRADSVDVLTEEGELVVTHKRLYGDTRTDTNDHRTSVAQLLRSAGAWPNSGVRLTVGAGLREYLDNQDKAGLRAGLSMLKSLNEQYGWDSSVAAMEMALSRGNLNKSDASIIAARMSGFGLDTPPEPGPPLSVYDDAFLKGGGHE